MRRRVFNFATAISALLAVAVGLLWVRSLSGYDLWEYQTAGDRLYSVLSVHGDVFLSSVDRKPSYDYPSGFSHDRHPVPEQWVTWTDSSPKPARTFRAFGIGFIASSYARKLVFAYWLLLALSLVLPGLWIRRGLLARGRNVAGRCVACGYDLRGTPDRCPECGTIPGQSAAA